jgi:hypothetical protein
MLPLVFFSYLWKLISEFKTIEKYRSAASKISVMVVETGIARQRMG